MKKILLRLICPALFCAAILCPIRAAALPLDPAAEASLEMHYQKEGKAFSALPIRIYRIAEAFPNGTFELMEPFASCPVNIHNVKNQEQWKNITSTLNSYLTANQIAPYRVEKTDGNGSVTFEKLETGLYLVAEAIGETDSGSYLFDRFAVYLPTPQSYGTYDYTVEARPKCIEFIPKTEYRVTKLWQDEGKSSDRPKEITVQIYKDKVLYESRVLSEENNWSYVWYVSADDKSEWTVAERSDSEHYTVTVQQNGNAFSLINTHQAIQAPEPPITGDTANLSAWILTMCISGILLILMGIYTRRKRGV